MGEKFRQSLGDVDKSNTEISFDNLVILKEFGCIVNLVKNEDFLEIVPKAKLRVKWLPLFKCLKQVIYEDMVKELNAMWIYENMSEKLEILEKQKEKFNGLNESDSLWRPQLGNVKSQLKANDVANLRKQKIMLESLAKEYETRVNKLKKNLTAKRGYLKALQMDIQQYQKKNEEFILNMNYKIENHKNLAKLLLPYPTDPEKLCWPVNHLDKEIK